MYQIKELLKYKNLYHAFSEKKDGNLANSINGKIFEFDEVIKNRNKFFKKINKDIGKSICMWVTHGDEIVEANSDLAKVSMLDYKKAVKTDGLMTNKKNLYLFLLIADCLPLIIYDPLKNAVALVHAGWKGISLNIPGKAVKKLNQIYKSNPSDLIVGIGPCVDKKSFIKENPSQKDDNRWKKFIFPLQNGKCEIDLRGFAKKQLIDAGVNKNNIFESKIDTGTDERFFSHVREKELPLNKQGRFACIVGLEERRL